ncbi:sigma-70 family RNA polymerase sigma factor [Paenibacillus melissococcoides]|uniref:Sigma-70 family RNA polymerase sigma factor n=1 Tax=Paenibacillus melissococcoides TaxID=2912268 RepID=A0ABM9GAM7_9BACL|nr:sigma-70 family RNA polymerase sigma factor [Paenibacillus melissococcoides]CAH8249076.1 sigma-70 family RNA polymerase sigma factor [Paenibacillus melissococcoides]
MDEAELRRIIADVVEGDTQKFEQIVQFYQKPIFLYCYHMLGHYSEAEDSAQEAFLKAFRALAKYNPDIPFGAWLYKIAYHQCIDVIRKRKLVKYLPFFYRDDKENKPVDLQIEAHYFDEFVHRAMSKLSAEERNLLILRCVEDKLLKNGEAALIYVVPHNPKHIAELRFKPANFQNLSQLRGQMADNSLTIPESVNGNYKFNKAKVLFKSVLDMNPPSAKEKTAMEEKLRKQDEESNKEYAIMPVEMSD